MTDAATSHSERTNDLFDVLDDVNAGMLGVVGSGQHMQPMHHYLDRDTSTLWFITANDTDLAAAIGVGAIAHFTVMSKGQDLHACMSGPITQEMDRNKLRELWSMASAAWFEEGIDDPRIVLLKMPLAQASVWTSTRNPAVFGFEILRANLRNDHDPDLGEHYVVDFTQAA